MPLTDEATLLWNQIKPEIAETDESQEPEAFEPILEDTESAAEDEGAANPELLALVARLQDENAALRHVAEDAIAQARTALAAVQSTPDVLDELRALAKDLYDEQVEALHREVRAFRRDVARRRTRHWWRRWS